MRRVAKRYARAYFEQIKGDPAQARKELESLDVVRQLFGHEGAGKLLKSPVMPQKLKDMLLDYALDLGKASESLRGFLKALVAAGRIATIPDVADALEELLLAAEGRVKADLATAVPVDAQTAESINAALAALFRKKIELTPTVDPELLGGFVVRVGNNLVDMSLKTRLDALSVGAVANV